MSRTRGAAAALVLLAAIAAVVLYRSAYDASDLDVVPDSVEYALVAARLASEGSLGISLEKRAESLCEIEESARR